MKIIKIVVFGFLFLLVSLLIVALVKDSQKIEEYNYSISYPHGKYEWTDYTDTIIHNSDNSISYVDEKGREVTRYGTYSIIKN